MDVFNSLDHIFVGLPLSDLDELKLLQQRLNFIFSVNIRIIAGRIIEVKVARLSLLNREHSPWVSLEIASDKVDRAQIEFR